MNEGNNNDEDSKFICINEEQCIGLLYCCGCKQDGSPCECAKIKEN